MKKVLNIILCVAVAALVSGCSLYSKFERPTVRNLHELYPADTTHSRLADLGWKEFFTDTLLQGYIARGLEYNIDLRQAHANVAQAEATLEAAKLAFLPSVKASLNATLGGGSGDGATFSYDLTPSASWEVDAFGKLRNAERGAKATYEATMFREKAVRSKIIVTIANSYYTLLMLDEQLKTSRRTLDTWEENIRTLEALKRAGKTNEAAVLQAKANKLNVEASILTLEKDILAMENSFCALVSIVPMPIQRSGLKDLEFPQTLSVGVPAELLSRRPDVRQAELALAQTVYAVNSAKAAFYPAITLSGAIGWTSQNGNIVLDPGSLIANFIGSLAQPIFGRGANKARLKAAQAQREAAAWEFRQSLLDAGVEVNNAVTLWQTAKKRVELDQKQILNLQASVWNTQLLMKHGNANYLEVLTAQKNLLQAELSEVSDKFDEIQAVINLYQALGGGY